MKQKEKVEILNKVADGCNPEQEAFFAIYATHKSTENFVIGDMNLVSAGIYNILSNGIGGDEEHPRTKLAWSILGAVYELRSDGVDIEALLDAFDDDEEEDGFDCPECERFIQCDNERAKAWRTILEIKNKNV